MPFRPERDDWWVERSRMDWEGRVYDWERELDLERHAPARTCSMCGRGREAYADCPICDIQRDLEDAA